MQMLKLSEVLERPIVGNAHDDHDLLAELAEIAGDPEQTINHRAAALRHMDLVMGVDTPIETDEEAVERYMRDIA